MIEPRYRNQTHFEIENAKVNIMESIRYLDAMTRHKE